MEICDRRSRQRRRARRRAYTQQPRHQALNTGRHTELQAHPAQESTLLEHAGIGAWLPPLTVASIRCREAVRLRRGRMAVIHRAAGRPACPAASRIVAGRRAELGQFD
jgi:hypothetical protein